MNKHSDILLPDELKAESGDANNRRLLLILLSVSQGNELVATTVPLSLSPFLPQVDQTVAAASNRQLPLLLIHTPLLALSLSPFIPFKLYTEAAAKIQALLHHAL